MDRRARVALVGYGLGGSVFHAPFIAAEPRLDLAAIVTGDPRRQERARARHPGAEVLGGVDLLLDRLREVDLVVISTPNATHAPLATEVLERGRPVVVDKPVAPTVAEVLSLRRLATSTGLCVVPFHNRRWDGDFRTVTDLLEGGELGEVHRVESRFERWQPRGPARPAPDWKEDPAPGAGTGILQDLGTHLVDQAVVLFGPPRQVYAELAVRRPGARVVDDMFVALAYDPGPRVHLWASALAANRGPRFRVLGSTGAYVKYGMDVQEEALRAGGVPGTPGWGQEPPASFGRIERGDGEGRAVPTRPGAYQAFYARMAACVLDGAPPPVSTDDAVVVARTVEAAARSAREGAVVNLEA